MKTVFLLKTARFSSKTKKNNIGTSMYTLEAKGLSKYYGKRHVVKGLSLSVGTGEIVGLLGTNGAGKTTTFYMIVGLIKPDGGNILLDGEDLTGLPMYRRSLKGISYLPQEPSIFRKLSVEDNIRAVLEIQGLRQDEIDVEVDRLLKEFHLTELSAKEGYKLSGGERRKTEIARAIAIKPRFILFDEPFAGIDPLAIIELKKMLTYLKGKGLGVLITDHNVRDTLSITDRAYIINNGEILEEGTPEKIIADPRVREAFLGEEFAL
jgi:lipopolysaccharide export system ATP-binding protein